MYGWSSQPVDGSYELKPRELSPPTWLIRLSHSMQSTCDLHKRHSRSLPPIRQVALLFSFAICLWTWACTQHSVQLSQWRGCLLCDGAKWNAFIHNNRRNNRSTILSSCLETNVRPWLWTMSLRLWYRACWIQSQTGWVIWSHKHHGHDPPGTLVRWCSNI